MMVSDVHFPYTKTIIKIQKIGRNLQVDIKTNIIYYLAPQSAKCWSISLEQYFAKSDLWEKLPKDGTYYEHHSS